MKKKIRRIPKFKQENDEREFWDTHDATEYFDFTKSNRVEIEFDPGIEAPVKSISLRLLREMLNELKRVLVLNKRPELTESEMEVIDDIVAGITLNKISLIGGIHVFNAGDCAASGCEFIRLC